MKNKIIMNLLIVVFALSGIANPGRAGERSEDGVDGAATQSSAYGKRSSGTSTLITRHIGSRTLANPDNLQMLMLGYRLTGQDAPLDRWAGLPTAVRIANEFDQPRLKALEYQRLAALYETTGDIGRLELPMTSYFAEYDKDRGGFYLSSLTPGQTYSYKINSLETVNLQIDNAGKAYFWPIGAAEAEELLKLSLRKVTLALRLDIVGAEKRQSTPMLHTRLRQFHIYKTTPTDKIGDLLMTVKVE